MGEFDDESGNESGGQLRSKLEASLAAQRDMAKELRGFKATALIAEKGFRYVTAEDLADVDLAELGKSAAAIEDRKGKERETVLRQVFTDQGVAEDQLDNAVAQFLAPKQESRAEQSTRIADLGRVHGTRVDTSKTGLTGQDLILASLKD